MDSINQELLNMSRANLVKLFDYCFDTKENKLYKISIYYKCKDNNFSSYNKYG